MHVARQLHKLQAVPFSLPCRSCERKSASAKRERAEEKKDPSFALADFRSPQFPLASSQRKKDYKSYALLEKSITQKSAGGVLHAIFSSFQSHNRH